MHLRQIEQVPVLVKVQCLGRADGLVPGFRKAKPVTQVGKPVLPVRAGQPLEVEVLPARVLDSLHKVEAGPAVDGNDGPVDGAALVPAAAAPRPHGALQVLLHVLVVLLVGVGPHLEGVVALRLQLGEPLVDVDAHGLDAEHQRPVGDG